MMYISFSGVNQTIRSLTHFRPQLPNGVTFIILGQHVSPVRPLAPFKALEIKSPHLSSVGSSQPSAVLNPARVDQPSALATIPGGVWSN
jgi:hypothetical protein